MKRITIILLFVSFVAKANTYYVALDGKDSNSGLSLYSPFLTMKKAIGLAKAGDQIYVRGGDYAYTSTLTLSNSGTEDAPIRFESYNNERVKINFAGGSGKGFTLSGNHWYLIGFDVTRAANNGILVSGAYNTVEFCSFYDNGNSGVQLSNGAHDNRIINCDSYWNVDTDNYADADGFACKMAVGDNNYFYGCRSWINVDDGWDGDLRGADEINTVVENCWTWGNGYLKDRTDKGYHANGQGFKMGGSDDKTLKHNFTLRNCLAFDNKANGFDQNNNKGNMVVQNCTGFRNNKITDYSSDGDGILSGANFNINLTLAAGKSCIIQNCLSFTGPVVMKSWVVGNTNSWDSKFMVGTDDFVSLDTTGVTGPRQADGSLPRLNLCRLNPSSDLVDTGTDIGLSYLGKAPDLGAFECDSNLTSFNRSAQGNLPVAFFSGNTLIIRRNNSFECILKLMDMKGHIVRSTTFSGEALDVYCDALTRGIYLLEFSGKGGEQVIKVIR